jgi:hypothetical protein
MRICFASKLEGKLSPDLIWRASVGGATEARVPARRCGELPAVTHARQKAEGREAIVGDRFRSGAANCPCLNSLCFGGESSESCLLLVPIAKTSERFPKVKSPAFVSGFFFVFFRRRRFGRTSIDSPSVERAAAFCSRNMIRSILFCTAFAERTAFIPAASLAWKPSTFIFRSKARSNSEMTPL